MKGPTMTTTDPLNPATTEEIRCQARHVLVGDRLLHAPVVGLDARPFRVEAVLPRDCHGLVTLVGEDRLALVPAEAECEVEREVDDFEPLPPTGRRTRPTEAERADYERDVRKDRRAMREPDAAEFSGLLHRALRGEA